MRFRIPPRLRSVWRFLRLPVVALVLYLALRPLLAALSASHGFGSPDGMSLPYLAIAALEVALRAALLTVIPALVVYQVTTRLLLGKGSPPQRLQGPAPSGSAARVG